MPLRVKPNQLFWALVSAPFVGVAYGVIAYAVTVVGCMPAFEDADFFGVRVTVFLLLALTVAALILILFAGWNVWRACRALQRRRRSHGFDARFGWGALGAAMVVAAFAGTAWAGVSFLLAPCP